MIKYFLLFTLVIISLFITNPAICHEKPTVGVIDLELSSEIPPSAKTALSDELRSELVNTGKFNVLERNSMAEILKEQKFQRTETCSETACIVEMGKVLGAQKMVAGSLGKVGNTYLLNVRLIDVATGSIEQIGKDRCKCELDELIGSIEIVAKKLAQLPVEEIMREELRVIDLELAVLLEKYTEKHPDVRAVLQKREKIIKSLSSFNPGSEVDLRRNIFRSSNTIEGKVIVVETASNIVVTDLGLKDGIKIGDILTVYRGSTFIAKIRVEKSEENMSAGVVLDEWAKGEIQKEDNVKDLE